MNERCDDVWFNCKGEVNEVAFFTERLLHPSQGP